MTPVLQGWYSFSLPLIFGAFSTFSCSMHAHLDCHVVGEYGLWDGLKVKGWYFLSLPLLVADSEFQQQRSGLWNQFPLHLTAYKQVAVVKRLARGYCELPVSHCSPELPGLPAATDMPLN